MNQIKQQTCETMTEPPFEIIDHRELRTRFPQNSSLLIVDFSNFNSYHKPGTYQQNHSNRKVYIVASTLPVVFAVDQQDLQHNFTEQYLEQVVEYLRHLRRIRIIQSLKSKNVIMWNLSTRQGPSLDRGRLDVSFWHPLLDTRISGETFQLAFCQNGAEVFCVLDMAQIHREKGLPDLEFPGNCCTMQIRLTRRSYTRNFTSLVWFVERRFKNSRVYFCAVKTDKITKVHFYFLPKQEAADGQMQQTLVLSHIEISIGSPSAEKAHSSTTEFLQNIKKHQLNQSSENYRFNIRPVDFAIADSYLQFFENPPNLNVASFHPTVVPEQLHTSPAFAENYDRVRNEDLSRDVTGVHDEALQERTTAFKKCQTKKLSDLNLHEQSSNDQNLKTQQHSTSGNESSSAAQQQRGFYRECQVRNNLGAKVSDQVEPRAKTGFQISSTLLHCYSNPPSFANAKVGESKLNPKCRGPVGLPGANEGTNDITLFTNTEKIKGITNSNKTLQSQFSPKKVSTIVRTKAIPQYSNEKASEQNLISSEKNSSIFYEPKTEVGPIQIPLHQFNEAEQSDMMKNIGGKLRPLKQN